MTTKSKTPSLPKPSEPQSSLPSRPLPFVAVNMAMTADGKIATANRAVTSFSSGEDHEHLLELRAVADAVMAGARTVDSAPVNLGPGGARFRQMRLKAGLKESNLRVIVTGAGTVNLKAEVFRQRSSPIILLTTDLTSKRRLKELREAADEVKVCGCNNIDFAMALRWLREKWGVQRLMCEGGGDLNAKLFLEGLVDELNLTICPLVFGGRTAPTIAEGLGVERLVRASEFELASMKQVSSELFLIYRRRSHAVSPKPAASIPSGRKMATKSARKPRPRKQSRPAPKP